MAHKVGYTEERPGVRSANRLAFLGGIAWAVAFTTVGTFLFKWGAGEIVAIFGGLSAPFFALKLIQKPMEKGSTNNVDTNSVA
jgi:hypothetical protein